MAVAFVALLAALSGTAIALPGTNSVDSGDIKNGQVKGKDIGKNAVTGKKVKNGSLTGADVRDNSLTGADVNESTLGQVPSANSANTANTASNANTVGGSHVQQFSVRRTFAGNSTDTLTFGPLTVTVHCNTTVGVDAIASTGSANNYLYSDSRNLLNNGTDDELQNELVLDGDIVAGAAFGTGGDDANNVDLLFDNFFAQEGTTHYSGTDGSNVTVHWVADLPLEEFLGPTGARVDCVFKGYAVY